jgi:septal ring factor EnvC (AmiA/AmiB activator)
MRNLSKVLTLLLIVAFVAGCGISKNEYDSVVGEMSTFQAKAKSLGKQVGALKAEHDKMVGDLASLKAENAKLLKENKALASKVAKLEKEKEALLAPASE